MDPTLKRLLDQRQDKVDFISQLLENVEKENRDMVQAEKDNLRAAQDRVKELDAQIKPLQEWEETRAAHQDVAGQVNQTRMPAPRGSGNGHTPLGVQDREVKYDSAGEFIVDYLRGIGQRTHQGDLAPDPEAASRVQRALGRSFSPEERAVAHQTTTDTPGLLPKQIIGEILNDLDGARPLVAAVGAKPLTVVQGKTFSRPYISQHTNAAEQTAEKQELVSRKLKVDALDFNKRTFGGTLNISRQEIDWTQPAAWNIIVNDLQMVYGEVTEDWAATQLVDGLTQTVEITKANGAKFDAWTDALYDAAVMAATANGTKRASAGRLPNVIFTSIDMWGSLGKMITKLGKDQEKNGTNSATAFAGDILDIERIVLPGLPAGSFVIGRKNMFEFYEERIGLLSAVEPSVLGIEVAYGGYVAAGHLDKTAFTTVTVATA